MKKPICRCKTNRILEQNLREEKHRSQQLLSDAAMPLCTVDSALRLTAVSRAFCAMLGYTEAELLLMRLPQLADNSTAQINEELFEAKTKTPDKQFTIDSLFVRKDGGCISVRNQVSMLRSLQDECTGFLLLVEDLADERKDKESIERLDRDLERSVRTLSLSRDQALETSRLKSAFIANVSHELRTPLSAILGLNDLLLQTDLSDIQRDFSQSVQVSAESLLSLVNELLDLSKIEADKIVIDKSPFNLPFLVEETVRFMESAADAKRLVLEAKLEANLPKHVTGDKKRLRQILLNFIGNAIKFTDTGGVEVKVMVAGKDEQNVTIRFEVHDTGIGISQEEQTRLFRPFIQIDDAANRKYEGTGLGLTISKRVIQLMDGQVGIISEKGKGSVFWFELQFDSTGAAPAFKPKLAAIPRKHRDEQILIVEDSPLLQKMVMVQLSQFGFEPSVVGNGKQAVETVINGDFDLIIMDCMLPGIDGFQATALIREHEKQFNRHTPIIAMTAAAMSDDRARCLNAGMDDYLSKPVDPVFLHEKVEQWLAYG